jgi:predicted urease superfamily metal-dependent hydrolase
MDEALTPSQRLKRSRVMKMKSNIIAKKRAISMKRRAPSEVIQKRAMKKARDILTTKILNNRSKSELGFGELENLEKKLGKKKSVIKKIAKKLLPQIKKSEQERIAKLRSSE